MRVRLWLLLAYLAVPFDLVPDVIPVLGYADDAVLVAWVLRSAVRSAGLDAVQAHWPGTGDGFAALTRLVGPDAPDTTANPNGGPSHSGKPPRSGAHIAPRFSANSATVASASSDQVIR